MVTSRARGRTRVALLRLALCYSVVPHRTNPYLTKIVRVCANQINRTSLVELGISADMLRLLNLLDGDCNQQALLSGQSCSALVLSVTEHLVAVSWSKSVIPFQKHCSLPKQTLDSVATCSFEPRHCNYNFSLLQALLGIPVSSHHIRAQVAIGYYVLPMCYLDFNTR